MIYLDIKRIVFSSKDNTFISENPKKLTIKHESAGNKYLRKTKNTYKEETNTNIKKENAKSSQKSLQNSSPKTSPKTLPKKN